MPTPETANTTLSGVDTLANVTTLIATVNTDWAATNFVYTTTWLRPSDGKYFYSITVGAAIPES